ncbi:glycosyltransferase [Patulibacter defluvii]|uniref:glycosyltransferase n=1 Tax=Patulibacter defluvii TaxID=3095358 RepID=UPI002A76474E|nr:glycosyltransferase [Patulibacter sp. DM4]
MSSAVSARSQRGPGGRPQIVLATRELFPFAGPFGWSGIGAYVAETAVALAPIADVTLVVADWLRSDYDRARATNDPRAELGGARIAWVAVPEPAEEQGYFAHMQLYGARVLERIRELFPFEGPDLIEFCDYLGEGFVTAEARRAGDPLLAETLIAVRLHTSLDICHALNEHRERRFDTRVNRELERRTLEQADVLLHGGGDVLDTYRRWYGPGLAPAVRVRHPLTTVGAEPGPAPDGPLRLLYIGRLERRKGLNELIEAMTAVGGAWTLSLVGGDSPTAPRGESMRAALERAIAGDERVRFVDAVPREQLPQLIADHDAVVLPSRWECWPYVGLEAMLAGIPLIGTPVGGLTEMVQEGVSGWTTGGTDAESLMTTLSPLIQDPARVRSLRGSSVLRKHVAGLVDADGIRSSYSHLLHDRPREVPGRRPRPAGAVDPLVSVVIPYYRMHRFLEDAVASAFAQRYQRIEVIVVNDGSFSPQDRALAEIASRWPVAVLSRPNGGLASARNFGIGQSRGRYVLPLDADNVLEPEFVERCVAVLEHDPQTAYVTSWNRYVDQNGTPMPAPDIGYHPLGNWCPLVEERNVAGDGTAVLRRSVFDRHRYPPEMTAYEDWALYRLLHRSGLHGRVIPERLWRYRVRQDSMLHTIDERDAQRLLAEKDAVILKEEMTWTSTSA